jgi:hypothetical protein
MVQDIDKRQFVDRAGSGYRLFRLLEPFRRGKLHENGRGPGSLQSQSEVPAVGRITGEWRDVQQRRREWQLDPNGLCHSEGIWRSRGDSLGWCSRRVPYGHVRHYTQQSKPCHGVPDFLAK